MTREETQDLLISICALYPSWNPENKTLTIDAWHRQLRNVDLKDAESRLEEHIQGSRGSFPPNVSELIPKQKEVYGFTGRAYSHDFFEQIEREVEENGGVY